MNPAQKTGRALGTMIATLETRILSWLMLTIMLTPQRFETWLAEHNFRRQEGNRRVVDYAGFARWIRNCFVWLFVWAFSFQLYALVIGHCNNNPKALGISLGFGFVMFMTLWTFWLGHSVGRINHGVATMLSILASWGIGAILLLPLVYQYYAGGSLPFVMPDKARELVAAGIPRYWAVLGFILNTLVLIPFLWMARLGPALLSLFASKTSESVKNIFTRLQKLLSSDEEENRQAAAELQKQSSTQSSMLLVAWSALSLLTISMLFSPTIWGLFGGLVIGMVAIVVFWLRESYGFIGYFLTKALYGVATGGLIFICTLYGLSLVVLMLSISWETSRPVFWLVLSALLVGIAAGILTTFYSTSEKEQEELAAGKGHISTYKRHVTGLNPDGTAITAISPSKPVSWKWLKSPVLWLGVLAIVWFVWTQVLGHPGPINSLMAMSFKKMMLYGLVACGIMVVYGLLPDNNSN